MFFKQKTCQGCQTDKKISCFKAKRRTKDGLANLCKDCVKLIPIVNKPARRSKLVIYWPNLKPAQRLQAFEDLLASQNGVCAICIQPFISNKLTHVDHCHTTGMVRGILCYGCNLGLGHFKDKADLLQRAIGYLGKYRSTP